MNKEQHLSNSLYNNTSNWRIKHIPWCRGRKSIISYSFNSDTWIFLIFCLFSIFFTILFISQKIAFIPAGLLILLIGLFLLIICRFIIGYISYKDFVRVEAKCIDQEIKNIDGPIPDTGFLKITKWAPRLLCEYTYEGNKYKVTPLIPYYGTFLSQKKVELFINNRINPDSTCILWINPKNKLHTLFHCKPLTVYQD